MTTKVPKVMTIAGSDSGGGAGIQADLKTFTAHATFGTSVITAITAQNTVGVQHVEPLSPSTVQHQLDSILSDISTDAIKTGMLFSQEVIQGVSQALQRYLLVQGTDSSQWGKLSVPLVVDPVMIATSSQRPLLSPDAIDALKHELIPLATLVTPNIPEAEALLGNDEIKIVAVHDMKVAAQRLQTELGPQWVLIKGGHMPSEEVGDGGGNVIKAAKVVVDVLWDGVEFHEFRHEYVDTKDTHGTGCTLSAAIAANLAKGKTMVESVQAATDYVHAGIIYRFPVGKGHGPLNHFHNIFA